MICNLFAVTCQQDGNELTYHEGMVFPVQNCLLFWFYYTVNQQILAAIKFDVSQNKVIYVNLVAIKFGVSPLPVYAVYDRRICWRRQILAKTRNSPNSPNIIARQNLLIYSIQVVGRLLGAV